jgi:hypothetical protein
VQSREIQPWLTRHETALVQRAMLAEHRQIDPIEAGRIARTPDHVADVGRPTVLQERLAVADSDGPRQALDWG